MICVYTDLPRAYVLALSIAMAIPSTRLLTWIYGNTRNAITTETITACTIIGTRTSLGADSLVMAASSVRLGTGVDFTALYTRAFITSIALTATDENGKLQVTGDSCYQRRHHLSMNI